MIYLLRGLDGFPPWILHSSIANQSKSKHSIAKSKAALPLDCAIIVLVPILDNYADTARIQSIVKASPSMLKPLRCQLVCTQYRKGNTVIVISS